ncbi:Cd(II)/Pb(II)-responsive transcriptional regulator [Pseudoalteromonas elyakovii]|uniref:Cd(II)/Pb(II)-responsive transcriptional regulator n=1 Tax=unclassified Pseudoalteromonas TaxID=194690 RepID=UPI001F487449|nr:MULTISPECIES: Cd(II)/Pb(II)-responsive transcriptional regulator [unclassified Pseudoalteromonas]MCF2917614.1 Cd(II)/Pb(II)-responsive transcriptional regulator [Pseudoalteromonas sp. Cn5-37]MCP4588648.1 Cd(II)/Pb(II)-responsive transcriptional regulator [Pseudoalteromonas sp.]MDC3192338.1 Cd(II)/Pb(II)-responsive transcriptional regulator [Pseudoalteromonas elyakovii]
MKIGQLSKVSGCSIQTIRYYEKEGLLNLPSRSEGNFRLYDDRALKELEFVKHCRSLDIPLADIKTLLELKNKPEESCSSINNLIANQLELVNQRIKELKALKSELQIMKKACSSDNTVEKCGIMRTLEV